MADITRKALRAMAIGAGATIALRSAMRWRRRMDFRGKVVVITGGSRGLGLLLARRFAKQGAKLAICSRDEAELERARQELGSLGAQVNALRCDVSSQEEVNSMIRGVVKEFGGVDVLINNAGIITVGPMETMTVEDYDEAMMAHFYGPLYTIEAALPSMRARGGGRIVNISSIGGKVPVPHLLPYVASKFALTGFSAGLREELKKDNVFVTTVFPGLMRTGSPRNAQFKGRHRAEYAWFSLGDSLPLISQSAERAADKIVNACCHGDAELVTSLPAKLAVKLFELFPGLMTDIAAAANRMMPAPGGLGTRKLKGHQSESAISRSPLTRLSDRAARRNNEIAPA